MRVLTVSNAIPYFPGPGAQAREFCLTRHLSAAHEITYLVPIHGDGERARLDHLSTFCSVKTFVPRWPRVKRPRRYLRRIQRYLLSGLAVKVPSDLGSSLPNIVESRQHILLPLQEVLKGINWLEYDLVSFQHSYIGYVALNVPIPIPSTMTWMDLHSSITRRDYDAARLPVDRFLNWAEWRRTKSYEEWVVREFTQSIAVSHLDATRLCQMVPSARAAVVPNGIESTYFANAVPYDFEAHTLVFTGAMDYEPNEKAMLYFCRRVLPLLRVVVPDIRLYIVGKQPTSAVRQLAEEFTGSVFVTGQVDDVRPFLRRAAVVIAPLLNGSGTRLKVLEAMAMQKAVVATEVGCEGLDVVNGQHIVVGNTPSQIASRILELLQDDSYRSRIAAGGHALVHRQYDWKRIATLQERVWVEVVTHGAKRGTIAGQR